MVRDRAVGGRELSNCHRTVSCERPVAPSHGRHPASMINVLVRECLQQIDALSVRYNIRIAIIFSCRNRSLRRKILQIVFVSKLASQVPDYPSEFGRVLRVQAESSNQWVLEVLDRIVD